MDKLPDEILMEILKRSYNHPHEILRSLSLVCKQWRRLYQDQYCWSKAELTLSCSDPPDTFLRHASVMTKAPRLFALTVVCKADGENKGILIKCLELCSQKNMKIEKLYIEFDRRDIFSHVFQFIAHNTIDSLRMLRLRIMARHWTSFPQCTFHIEGTTFSSLEIIMLMRTLEMLEITTDGYVLFNCSQKIFFPPLKTLILHSVGVIENSSLELFARRIIPLSSHTLKCIDLHVTNMGQCLLPDICLPYVVTLKFGYLDNPFKLKTQLFPNLTKVSFKWLMLPSDNICKNLINMLHMLRNIYVSCKVVMFGRTNQVFNEQKVKDCILSHHSTARCDLTFQLHCF